MISARWMWHWLSGVVGIWLTVASMYIAEAGTRHGIARREKPVKTSSDLMWESIKARTHERIAATESRVDR